MLKYSIDSLQDWMDHLDMSPANKKKFLDNYPAIYKYFLQSGKSLSNPENCFFVNGDAWSNNFMYKRWQHSK